MDNREQYRQMCSNDQLAQKWPPRRVLPRSRCPAASPNVKIRPHRPVVRYPIRVQPDVAGGRLRRQAAAGKDVVDADGRLAAEVRALTWRVELAGKVPVTPPLPHGEHLRAARLVGPDVGLL